MCLGSKCELFPTYNTGHPFVFVDDLPSDRWASTGAVPSIASFVWIDVLQESARVIPLDSRRNW